MWISKILSCFANTYFYIVGMAIIILAIFDIRKTIREKNKWRTILLAIVIFVTAIVPVLSLITETPLEKEEFSTNLDNIEFLEGKYSNIVLKPKRPVIEPINLRVKDDWRHLVYLTDYNITDENKVVIGYEFGNNKEENKKTAKSGLVFTYKTRRLRGTNIYL